MDDTTFAVRGLTRTTPAGALVQYPDTTLADIEEPRLRTDLRGGDDTVGAGVDLLK